MNEAVTVAHEEGVVIRVKDGPGPGREQIPAVLTWKTRNGSEQASYDKDDGDCNKVITQGTQWQREMFNRTITITIRHDEVKPGPNLRVRPTYDSSVTPARAFGRLD